jgi:class 3 adenylate cyclase
MICSVCGTRNPEAKKFCLQCGSALPLTCPKCGGENPTVARFCGDCGTSLAANLPTPVANTARATVSAIPPQVETPSSEGERKTITALFADIKGSMELIEDLDPEQARNIIDPALIVMGEAIRRYGGHVVQSTGDGIFAIFGAPLAHEDHAQRALYAALRMQDELNRYSARMGAEGRKRVQARVGINTGEAVVRSLMTGGYPEYSPIGHSIGLAARMEALAPIGSVAVTGQTRKLCDGYFNFKPLGTAQVRGASEPVGVYEVIGLGPLRTHFQLSAERGFSNFVGRQSELEQLNGVLALVKGGRGQLVAVLGDAGVGKSRLFHQFKLAAQSECTVLETFSLAHGNESSYLPVIELLKNYFAIGVEDDRRRRREDRMARLLAVDSGRVFSPWRRRARQKVTSKVLALDRRLEDTLPYLFALLGIQDSSDPLAQMDPQIRRRRTLEAVKRVLLRQSLNQPLMLVFEDLHWLDDETQAFLNLLADSVGNAPLLLLVNYRPDYHHGWNNKSNYTQIRLEPLGTENAEELLDVLLSMPRAVGGADSSSLRRLIIEKTEGNPFFIEEMVQALLGQEIPLEELRLPPTVQAVLSSRIDRLAPREKELLQTLAVIGRQFSVPLINRVAAYSENELEGMIATLRSGEFIYERPAFPEVEYAFKHALTQEVAYNSLLLDRRKTLHERIAQALEALFVDSIDDHLTDLAYHYSRSRNDSRAIDYLVRAGEQAQQRSAYSQAGAYLEQALVRLNDQPAGPERYRKEFAIRAGLADSAIVMSGYASPEYEHHLTRRHELAQRLGDTTQIFYSLVGMSVLSAFRLELTKAQDIGWKLLGIADHEHDPDMQLEAHGSLANVLWLLGDIIGSLEHSERGLRLFRPEQHLPYGNEHWRAACHFYACNSTAALGFPDKGLRQSLEFLAWARERAQLISLVFALNGAATILAWRGEGKQALKYADDLLALTAEHGFSLWHSFGQLVHGQTLALLAKTDEAIGEIKTALESLEASGAAIPGWAHADLAFALLTAKQPEEGLRVIAKAREVTAKTSDAEATPELHRLNGELLLMANPTKLLEGEESFQAAIEVARKQSAKSAELRATMSLARMLTRQDRSGEARTLLAEIYGWFNEGFDTADLRDAKALLDQLNR